MTAPSVQLLVSIDTEEDNWIATRDDIRIDNIRELPRLQDFLEGLGLRPTYFVDYPVATTPWSAAILREIDARGEAEIAAHLHPWNTPPLDEALCDANTMMLNLSPELQRAKLKVLKAAIAEVTGKAPTTFRAGRLGLGGAGAAALIDASFDVDSSVTPYVDWSESGGPDFRAAPASLYSVDGKGPLEVATPGGPLVEVPISCGFTRRPFGWRSRSYSLLTDTALRKLRLAGIGSRLGILRRVIGSPETDRLEDLLAMARCLIDDGVRVIQLFFHSPSLVPGFSPFVRNQQDLERLYQTLAGFVEGLSQYAQVETATVGEAGRAWAARARASSGGD